MNNVSAGTVNSTTEGDVKGRTMESSAEQGVCAEVTDQGHVQGHLIKSTYSRNKLECWSKCATVTDCKSISFQSKERKCEMYDIEFNESPPGDWEKDQYKHYSDRVC